MAGETGSKGAAPASYVLAANQAAGEQALLANPGMTMEQWQGLFSPEQIQQQATARRIPPEALREGLRYDFIGLQHWVNGARGVALQKGLSPEQVLTDPDARAAGDKQASLAFQALEQDSNRFSVKFWDVLQNGVARSVTEGVVGGGLAAIVGGLLGGKKAILPAAVIGAVGMLVARHLFKDEKGAPYLDKAWSWLQQKFQSGHLQEVEAARVQLQQQGIRLQESLEDQWGQALRAHTAAPLEEAPPGTPTRVRPPVAAPPVAAPPAPPATPPATAPEAELRKPVEQGWLNQKAPSDVAMRNLQAPPTPPAKSFGIKPEDAALSQGLRGAARVGGAVKSYGGQIAEEAKRLPETVRAGHDMAAQGMIAPLVAAAEAKTLPRKGTMARALAPETFAEPSEKPPQLTPETMLLPGAR